MNSRTLNFKQNEVIFGGGRLKGISQTTIPLSWDALMDVYDQANQSAEATQKPERRKVSNSTPDAENAKDEPQQVSEPVEEQETPETEENQEQQVESEKPKTRVRKRRGEN